MRRFFWIAFVLTLFAVLPAQGATNIPQALAQAKSGVVGAQVQLGHAYQYGKGVKQDYQKALFWYEKAAKQGEAEAQRPLGAMYEMGLGAAQDFGKAAFWYEKAAQQGLARAQVNLGILYEKGQGVEKDYQKALSWYQKAAERGYGRGANHLGMLYEKGFGVKKDIFQARQLYKQGAMAKYSKAMLNLGRIYEQGLEGEKNLEEAAYWYQRAVKSGYKKVIPDLNRVKSLLAAKLAEERIEIESPKKVQIQPELEEKAEVEEVALEVIEVESPQISLDRKKVDTPSETIVEETNKPLSVEERDLSPQETEKIQSHDMGEKNRASLDPDTARNSYFVSLIIIGNLSLALLFWFFMTRRSKRSSTAIIAEIGSEIRVIRKQVEELKDDIG